MSFRILVGLALCLLCVCASLPASTMVASQQQQQQPEELPPGKGRDLLEAACTSCHEIEEVLQFRGKYGRDEWRIVLRTMVDYGAELSAKDLEVLAEYLDQHLGKRQ